MDNMTSYGTRELILLSLKDYDIYKEREKVPYGISLSGLANTVGSGRDILSEEITKLIDDGLVEKKSKYVRGRNRKRNVYFLTDKGTKEEKRLREVIKKETIKIKIGEEVKQIPLGDIEDYIEQEDPLVKTLSSMEKYGLLDLSEGATTDEIFVGRCEEMNILRNKLKEVKETGSWIIFISGEAGVGKTRLVSEFKTHALDQGWDFLVGTCLSEMADPYLPFKEAFDEYLKESDEADIKSMGRIAFVGAIRGLEISNKKMFDVEREATFYETTEYIRNISEDTSLVVFLDDVQWMDKASAQILNYMAHKLGSASVLFICAYRSEDLRGEVSINNIFQHMKNSCRNVVHMDISPLGEGSTEMIIKGLLREEDVPKNFMRMIHEKTSGNPLFVKECVKHMLEEGVVVPENKIYPKKQDVIRVPDIIQTVIERRINRLDSKSKKVLEVGSVMGDAMDFTHLLEVMDTNTFDLLDHIDILVATGLWRESPDEDTIYFHHSITRDTVYSSLRDIKKRLLHDKIAGSMENLHSHELQEVSPLLAYHYHRGQKYENAFVYYNMAGKKAKGIYAHEDAIEMFENALDIAEGIENCKERMLGVKEELADIYSILGDFDRSREYLQSILDADTDTKTQLRIYRKISAAWLNQNRLKEALESVDQGLSLIDDRSNFDLVLCKMLSLKGWVYLRMGDNDRAMELFEREKEIAHKIDDDTSLGQSYHDMGTLYYLMGELDESAKSLQDAIEIWKRSGDDHKLTTSLNNLGLVKMYRGEWGMAKQYFKENLGNYERIGDNLGIAISLNNLGDVYREKGEFETALECFNKAKSIEEKISNTDGVAGCITNKGITYHKMGELDRALEHHKNSLGIYHEVGNKSRASWTLHCMGEVYMSMGELEKALEVLEESYEIKTNIGDNLDLAPNLATIGEVLLELGDIAGARKKEEKALELAKDLVTKETEGRVRKVLGKIYREKGDYERAEKEFKESEKILEYIAITEYPKTLYELGLLYKIRNQLNEAVEYINNALDMFQSMGMNYWTTVCRSALDEIKPIYDESEKGAFGDEQ